MSNNLQIQSLVLARVRGFILLTFENKLPNVPFYITILNYNILIIS